MADTKTSALTALTGAGSATGDKIPIDDVSATTLKSITLDELRIGLQLLGITPWVINPAINETFANPGHTGGTVNGGSYQRLDITPIQIYTTMTVDRIVATCDTAVASSVFRMGIYSSDANGRPAGLLLDAGTVSTATTGQKTITISQVLAPGLYWLAIAPQVVTGSLFRYSTGMVGIYNIAATITNIANVHTGFRGDATVTGALPGTITITEHGNSQYPIIGLRRSA